MTHNPIRTREMKKRFRNWISEIKHYKSDPKVQVMCSSITLDINLIFSKCCIQQKQFRKKGRFALSFTFCFCDVCWTVRRLGCYVQRNYNGSCIMYNSLVSSWAFQSALKLPVGVLTRQISAAHSSKLPLRLPASFKNSEIRPIRSERQARCFIWFTLHSILSFNVFSPSTLQVNHFKDYIPKAFPHGNDLILDSEVLMIDTNTSKPLPFGTLGVHKVSFLETFSLATFVTRWHTRQYLYF